MKKSYIYIIFTQNINNLFDMTMTKYIKGFSVNKEESKILLVNILQTEYVLDFTNKDRHGIIIKCVNNNYLGDSITEISDKQLIAHYQIDNGFIIKNDIHQVHLNNIIKPRNVKFCSIM